MLNRVYTIKILLRKCDCNISSKDRFPIKLHTTRLIYLFMMGFILDVEKSWREMFSQAETNFSGQLS